MQNVQNYARNVKRRRSNYSKLTFRNTYFFGKSRRLLYNTNVTIKHYKLWLSQIKEDTIKISENNFPLWRSYMINSVTKRIFVSVQCLKSSRYLLVRHIISSILLM